MSTRVGQYEPIDLFLFVDQSSPFFAQRGRGSGWSIFQMFDILIPSGDIRDQSLKLSEIAPKFGRFFGPPKF